MNTKKSLKRGAAFTLAMAMMFFFLSCEENESKIEADSSSIIEAWLLSQYRTDYYTFDGVVNRDLTPSCGEATEITTASSAKATTTRYRISLYYIFDEAHFDYSLGRYYLYMKFVYDPNETEFSLSPSTTNTSTCPTLDYISCNGTSGTNPECTTVDGLTCGGENAFSFVSVSNTQTAYPGSDYFSPDFSFQAQTGSIDYSGGFSLDTNSAYVTLSDLDFNMISADGTVFKGNVYCDDYN